MLTIRFYDESGGFRVSDSAASVNRLQTRVIGRESCYVSCKSNIWNKFWVWNLCSVENVKKQPRPAKQNQAAGELGWTRQTLTGKLESFYLSQQYSQTVKAPFNGHKLIMSIQKTVQSGKLQQHVTTWPHAWQPFPTQTPHNASNKNFHSLHQYLNWLHSDCNGKRLENTIKLITRQRNQRNLSGKKKISW